MVQLLIDSQIPLRLSCLSTSNWPIVISLMYIYISSKFYCATQNTSKIVKYIQKHDKCGFEIAGDSPPYKGVRGYGKASIMDNKGEEILRLILQKYLKGKETSKLCEFLLSKKHLYKEVAIEIMPARMFEWDYTERMSDSV